MNRHQQLSKTVKFGFWVICMMCGTAIAQEKQPSTQPFRVRGELPTNASMTRITIEDALSKALEKDPRIAAARKEGEAYDAKAEQIKGAWLQGSYEGMLAPITALDGNAIDNNSGEFPLQPGNALGVFTRHQISLNIPFVTFGKLKAGLTIAGVAENTGEELIRRAQAEVAQDVRRAYYGSLFADDVLDLLEEAQSQLSKAKIQIEEGIANDTGDFTKVDLYKLAVAEAEIQARSAEARAGLAFTRSALSLLTGEANVHPAEDYLSPVPGELLSLSELQSKSLETRPEISLLELAVKAKTSEAEYAKANLYPNIEFQANGIFSASNVAEPQASPFAYDIYNQRFATIGIGVRYSLDIGVKRGKAKEVEAAKGQLESLQKAALGGISLEIEKVYRDAASAKERMIARESGDSVAKKWLTSVASSFIVGNAETRDLIEALVASGDNHAKYLQAVVEYNIAIGAITKAVGTQEIMKK